jgi:hypothetical protein
MNFAQTKELDRAAEQVRAFMRKRKITVEDLINIGGEDLQSPDFNKAERARHVGQCWQLMARLSIHFADLEHVQ